MGPFTVVGFAVISPVVLDVVNSELYQALALWLCALGAGYLFGSSAPTLKTARYVIVGVAAGVLSYVAVLLHLLIVYPGVTDPPYAAWFARFALAGALAFSGGSVLGSRGDRSGLAAVFELCSVAIGIVSASATADG